MTSFSASLVPVCQRIGTSIVAEIGSGSGVVGGWVGVRFITDAYWGRLEACTMQQPKTTMRMKTTSSSNEVDTPTAIPLMLPRVRHKSISCLVIVAMPK